MDSIESSKPALQSRRASSCQESSDSDNTLSMPEDVEKNITILNEKEEGKGGMSEGSELEEEVIWVTWEEGDESNPLNFPKRTKWMISSIGIVFCALVSLSVSGYAIAQTSVIVDLKTTQELAILGITLFTITFGSAPLILAPLSETYGRSPIYLISAVGYAVFFLPQIFAQNIETLLVCRFLSGVFGSTAVSLVGGTISDLFSREERGLPMAMFAFAAFASTGLGPMMFGYVEERYNFRIVSWIMFAMATFFAFILFFVTQETRASVLLARKAAKLRESTGDSRYQSRDDAGRGSLLVMMKTSMIRPVKMLVTEPVLLSASIYIAFCWSVLYILLESIALVYGGVYQFSVGQSGLVFTSQVVGSFLGLLVDYFCNKRYRMTVDRLGPEARLYQGIAGGILLPIGSFIYAWTSFAHIHWIFSCIGITILYCGLYLIYLCVFSYVADCYTYYASSALSAQSFLRNCVGAVMPLFTPALYAKIGIQGAGSLVGGLAVLLAAIPFVLFCFGARLRAKSRFAKEMALMQS